MSSVATVSTAPRRLVSRALPRVGVLGASRIVPKALLTPGVGLVDVCAVAARDPERALKYAQTHGIAESYGSYEALLERPDIDAVYVALPAAAHAEWSLAALSAGKHVLCEKPFGLSSAEADACVARARAEGLLLMEAHHWRYHPLVSPFCEAVAGLGSIVEARAVFDAAIGAGNIRLDAALGAGVLLDFGCYTIQWLALASGDPEPQVLEASAVEGDAGVDVAFRATLRSAAGARLSLSCDMRPGVTFLAFVEVLGERGKVTFENPLNGEDARVIVEQDGVPTVRYEAPGPTTYRRQLEVFSAALKEGTDPETTGLSIVQTQTMLDRLYLKAGLPARDELARGSRRSATD